MRRLFFRIERLTNHTLDARFAIGAAIFLAVVLAARWMTAETQTVSERRSVGINPVESTVAAVAKPSEDDGRPKVMPMAEDAPEGHPVRPVAPSGSDPVDVGGGYPVVVPIYRIYPAITPVMVPTAVPVFGFQRPVGFGFQRSPVISSRIGYRIRFSRR